MEDKYKPRKTGLFDVGVTEWEGKESTNKLQQWWWDERDHALHNYGHAESNAILFEGFNKNLVIYRDLKRDSQKFSYNGSTGFWRNDHTKRALTVDWASAAGGEENVVTREIDTSNSGGDWEIHYCSNEPTNISAGGE